VASFKRKKKLPPAIFLRTKTMNPFTLPVAVILPAVTFILGGGLEIGIQKHRRKWLPFAAGGPRHMFLFISFKI
jgi:hypothetical protein